MYIKVDTENQINSLVEMANDIWSGYFRLFFDNDTLSKLIEAAQSKRVILGHIEKGYQYYFINEPKDAIGYFAYELDSVNRVLFLQKLYIYPDYRKKGFGKSVLHYLENICEQEHLNKICLTVYYKNNDAINAYQKWGFKNLGLIKRNFGNGLIFKDCKMEMSI